MLFAGFLYVLGKSILEFILADMWNMIKRASKLLFSMRIVHFDDCGMTYDDALAAAQWIGGDMWTENLLDFMTGNKDSISTTYTSPTAGRIYGPMFDDGIDLTRQYPMFGFDRLGFGNKLMAQVRKSVDGWPVWVVSNGIHSFIADNYKVMHQNSARFGNHRPAVLIICLSFTPKRVLVKVAQNLRMVSASTATNASQSKKLPISYRNYHAIIRTEERVAELEWVLRKGGLNTSTTSWPIPSARESFELACGMINDYPHGRIKRLNILLHGTYGTGKTRFGQMVVSRTGAHLVLVTRNSTWSAILDAIYNTAPGPKVLLFDEFDTFFEDEVVQQSAQSGSGSGAMFVMGGGNGCGGGGGGGLGYGGSGAGGGSSGDCEPSGKSFLSQGGVLNFRKKWSGYVMTQEEDSLMEKIESMPRQLLQEHHLLSLLDGTAFSSYEYPVACFMCTNYLDKIPERITRWGRVTIKQPMEPHTLESALDHARGFETQVRALFDKETIVTPARLQSLIDTSFLGQ